MLPFERQIRMARAAAVDALPWFAKALFSARLVISDQAPAAAVDRWFRVYFNPEKLKNLVSQEPAERLRQLAWIWIHEISHVVRDHGDRAKGRQHHLWNVACDMEINDSKWPGLEIPEPGGCLLPSDHDLPDGQLAEFYYDAIVKNGEVREVLLLGGQLAGQSDGQLDEGSGVSGGERRPWELAEVDDVVTAVSEFEQQGIRKDVAEGMLSDCRGMAPMGWNRWADEIGHSRVNWRERLRRCLSQAMQRNILQKSDYSFRRPHRRASTFSPFIRPTLTGESAPKICVVVDTSGSIDDGHLRVLLAEIRGVLEAFKVPITVIACDAEAYEPMEVSHSTFARLQGGMRGGGGTDMRVGVEAALKLDPDVVLVLTDGETPFPNVRPKTPVIWGIFVETGYAPSFPPNPPWRQRDIVEVPMKM